MRTNVTSRRGWLLPVLLLCLLGSGTAALLHVTVLTGTSGPRIVTGSAVSAVRVTGAHSVPPVLSVRHHPGAFEVSVGAVRGLVPNVVTDLPVSYGNPTSSPLVVVSARVTGRGTLACPARYLVTGTYRARVTVPGQSTVSARLPIGLTSAAPDACKSGQFSVRVTARAVR